MRWVRGLSGRLSITARITLGSFVIALLVGVVAVVGIRAGVSAILHNATLTLLRYDAAPFEQDLQTHPGAIDDEPSEGQYVALVNPAGTVTLDTLPDSLRPYGHVPLASGESTTVVVTSKHQYIVRSQPVETSDGLWHVITARNQDSNQLVLTRLSVALVIAAIVLVGSFTLASFILARTALRPVNAMRRQADRLARRQSAVDGPADDELLEVPPVRDELAALAVTLNGLIAGLRASADREKQLVSDASHELRTPLAVLRGELELAALDAGDADALLGDVRKAQHTVLRLSNLATNLLELSRIDQRGSRGSSTWAQLRDELAAAIDRMRMAASVRGVDCTVDFDVAVDVPAVVDAAVDAARGDAEEWIADEVERPDDDTIGLLPQEFGRLVDNLIGNAINAIGERGGPGAVMAHLDRDEDAARLSIVDDGPGMPPDFMPVALDRFTRVDAARDTSTGSGLGLAIVAALVRAADGGIALADTPGGGLTVTVTLPFDEAALDGFGPLGAFGPPDDVTGGEG